MIKSIPRYLLFLLSCLLFVIAFSAPSKAGSADDIVQSNNYTKIINGSKADVAKWPFMVSLVLRRDFLNLPVRSAYWGHYCGGVLLKKQWVLTAAHCLRGINTNNIDVVIGRTNLNNFSSGEKIPVIYKSITQSSEKYRQKGLDIGLLRLAYKSKKGKPLGTARIASPSSRDIFTSIAGWGIDRLDHPSYLQEALNLPLHSQDVCQSIYNTSRPIFDSRWMLCAGNLTGGSDACSGDSGGPLMQNGLLIGITSWGIGCGEEGYPGVYAKVSAGKSYIEKILNNKRNVDWKIYRQKGNKKPVKESKKWRGLDLVMQDLVTYKTDYGVYYLSEVSSNTEIKESRISSQEDAFLCPGNPSEYEFIIIDNSAIPLPDSRCRSGKNSFFNDFKIGYGSKTLTWEGWSASCSDIYIKTILPENEVFSRFTCGLEKTLPFIQKRIIRSAKRA